MVTEVALPEVTVRDWWPHICSIVKLKCHNHCVNTSGKAGAQIPHLPLGDDSSPWGDNPVRI
jgi:hypothetical protein